MLWASFTLIYYGCLRAGEVVIDGEFKPSVNLRVADVTLSVAIKASKTDKTNAGFAVVIACVPHVTCAVCAMSSYLESKDRTYTNEPLFCTQNGTLLTKTLFQKQIKLYIAALGYSPDLFSGHSFRAGCATDAATAGFMDWELKLLGRWTSDAYQGYIRAPRRLLAQFSTRIVQQKSTTVPSPHNMKYVNNSI